MKTKKLLSWLLVLCMVFGLLPGMSLTASAEGAETTANLYDELAQAISNGGTIQLTKDYVVTGSPMGPGTGKTTTIDLNGHTIDASSRTTTSPIFQIQNGATLNITDSSEEKTGKFIGGGTVTASLVSASMNDNQSASFSMENVTVTGFGKSAPIIQLMSGSNGCKGYTVNLKNVVFEGNKVETGYKNNANALVVIRPLTGTSSVTMDNVEFRNNTGLSSVSLLNLNEYVNAANSKYTIKNCIVENNTGFGCLLDLSQGNNIQTEIIDTKIENNEYARNAILYAPHVSTRALLRDVSITGNKATTERKDAVLFSCPAKENNRNTTVTLEGTVNISGNTYTKAGKELPSGTKITGVAYANYFDITTTGDHAFSKDSRIDLVAFADYDYRTLVAKNVRNVPGFDAYVDNFPFVETDSNGTPTEYVAYGTVAVVGGTTHSGILLNYGAPPASLSAKLEDPMPTFTYGTAATAVKVAELTAKNMTGDISYEVSGWYDAETAGNKLTTNIPTATIDGTAVKISTDATTPIRDYYVEITAKVGTTTAKTRIKVSVTKANDNAFTGTLTMDGWNYGETPSTPSGLTAKYGTITYTYYKDNNGVKGSKVNSVSSTTAPGDYWVTAKVTGTTSYNAITETDGVQFTIGKGTPTVTAPTAKSDLTYTGSAQSLVNSGSATNGNMQYRLGETGTFSTSSPKATDAGTYKVYYKAVGKTNYNDTDPEYIEVTISPKSLASNMLSVTVNGTASQTSYTGSAITPTVVVKDDSKTLTKDTDYTVSGADAKTDVGEYTITVTAVANTNYTGSATVTWKIVGANFANGDITATGYNEAYDGQAHSITVTAPTGATVTYSTDGTNYSATNPTATDVGTTTVYYKVSKTGYNDKTGNADIVITKATATSAMTTPENNPFSLKAKKDATVEITLPALPDDGASYGTVNNSNTSLFTVGAISGGKVTVTSAKDWDEATDGGNKTFTVLVTGAANYNNYYITVTIAPMFKTKLTVSGVSMDKESYTYGGTVGYTGTVSMKNGEDAVTGITPEYTYYQTSDKGTTWTKLNAAPTDAGDYKLVVSIPESNDDYEGSQEITFSIAMKSVTAPSANTNTFTYTGSEQSYMTIAETADYKLTSDSAAASQTNAGTYTIKLELKDTANCQWAEGAVTEFTFVINPRVTIKDQTGAVVCNGVDTKLDGSYKLPEGTTLKPGTYQVVTELGSKTITTILVVEDGTEPTTTVTIPTKDVSSEVEIKTTEGTPKITVGGLDNLANTYTPSTGESITVTMTVEAKPADPSSEAQTAIKAVNDAQTTKVSKFDFVDMSIIKESFINGTSNGTNDIHDAQGVLEIIVPFTTSGRKDITVFRYHNDGVNTPETKAFEKLDTRPTTGFADGKFFVGDGFIVVYAQYFSEYAIGYEEEQDDPYIPYIPVTPSYTITGANTENGKLTISRKTASAGQTVTITVKPDEGYKLNTLTVKDITGKELTLTKVNDTTYTFKMPIGKVTVSATFTEVKTACPQDETCVYAKFTDADTKAWYHDGVHFCVENGYMQGVSATAFDPAGTTTRAMIVTMLWRMEGEPVANYAMSFKDVKADQWYTEAIRWAQSTGVVEGYSAEAFGPDDPITREQMATILYRYAKYHEIDVANTNTLAGYTDVNKVSAWALDAIKWANAVGLVQGRTTTTLVPEVSITRAEAATMVQRYCEKVCED